MQTKIYNVIPTNSHYQDNITIYHHDYHVFSIIAQHYWVFYVTIWAKTGIRNLYLYNLQTEKTSLTLVLATKLAIRFYTNNLDIPLQGLNRNT